MIVSIIISFIVALVVIAIGYLIPKVIEIIVRR